MSEGPDGSTLLDYPCLMSLDSVVSLRVQVARTDLSAYRHRGIPPEYAVGMVAERLARQGGYRPEEITRVETDDDRWIVHMEVTGHA